MKLKFSYDNNQQIIEIDTTEAAHWVNLKIEDGEISEDMIQKRVDDEWNKPEYNSWHKFDRHRGCSKARPGKDDLDTGFDPYNSEPLMKEVMDDRIFRKDEIQREYRESYEEICKWIREVLVKKPNWAEAFIAVRMDDMSVNDYARSIGVKDASVVSKWLARAAKKLAKNYGKRQI